MKKLLLMWFSTILLVVICVCQLEAQVVSLSEDPFASDSTPKEAVDVSRNAISSGHRQTIDMFSSMFPSSEFDPVAYESVVDPLKPHTTYCFCFETGVLVSFDFFPSKSSHFTVLLLPVHKMLRDAKLKRVNQKFVSSALQVDPKVFSQFLSGAIAGGMGGMGTKPLLNVSLPSERLTALRNHSKDASLEEEPRAETAEEKSDKWFLPKALKGRP